MTILSLRLNLCFMYCILNLLYSTCLSCPRVQKEALLEFKSLVVLNDTDYYPFLHGLGLWNSSLNCCGWHGVICDTRASTEEVTALYLIRFIHETTTSDVLTPLFRITSLEELDLYGNGIEGELSGEGIANLTRLVYLDLENNNFNGPIPPHLFNLLHLQHLGMSDNSLSGEIPNEIGNLLNLSYLALSRNKLTGAIPRSIRKLERLEFFDLYNNQISGLIPTWLLELEKIIDLRLGRNKLAWINDDNGNIIVPRCSLQHLSLSSCSITGPVPQWLSSQTKLIFLDLSENMLEGTFPLWLATDFSNLEILFLYDNMFTGSLSASLFQRDKLIVLDLSRNNFHGELPENIGNVSQMQILSLSNNNFFRFVPHSISNLSELDFLDLSSNSFSGDQFPVFNSDAWLSYIDLSSNKFSGEIPTSFGESISMLFLGQNEFSGLLPDNLTKLYQLELLDLQDNKITGEIPASLSKLSSLRVLNLRNNYLQGSISDNLDSLSNLGLLDLSNNHLTGIIPSSLGNLSGMANTPDISSIAFKFANLSVTDGIGTKDLLVIWKKSRQGLSYQHLGIYSFLDLSQNRLSGEIPSSLGTLKHLKSLNLSYNSFSGAIPTTFGDMKILESLDLSHNNLSGEIPQTFSKLLELNVLDVSNNRLSGCIPKGPQMDRLNDPNFYANNSGLCGMQIQVPCEIPPPPPPPPPPLPPPPSEASSEEEETWFSWEFAGIGYPVGFFSAIGVAYGVGYFDIKTRHDHHHRLIAIKTSQRGRK